MRSVHDRFTYTFIHRSPITDTFHPLGGIRRCQTHPIRHACEGITVRNHSCCTARGKSGVELFRTSGHKGRTNNKGREIAGRGVSARARLTLNEREMRRDSAAKAGVGVVTGSRHAAVDQQGQAATGVRAHMRSAHGLHGDIAGDAFHGYELSGVDDSVWPSDADRVADKDGYVPVHAALALLRRGQRLPAHDDGMTPVRDLDGLVDFGVVLWEDDV